MICLQGEERQAITLPDLEHIDVHAAHVVRWNHVSIWYTTDASQYMYKYCDSLQADRFVKWAECWICDKSTGLISMFVDLQQAQFIKGAILSQYLDHKFCIHINHNRHEISIAFVWDEVFHKV